MNKQRLLLRFEEGLKEKLKQIATEERRSLTSQIVKILSDYCDQYNLESSRNGR